MASTIQDPTTLSVNQPTAPQPHIEGGTIVDVEGHEDIKNIDQHREELRMLREQKLYLTAKLEEREQAHNEDISTIIATPPEFFYGIPEKLQPFLTRLLVYFSLFPIKHGSDKSKVEYAAGRLRGKARKWFMSTYLQYANNPKETPPDVDSVLSNYDNFVHALKQRFGLTDEEEELEAEDQLMKLRQTGSVADYTARFLTISFKLQQSWGEKPLMARLYYGLKDHIKYELFKRERPNTVVEYAQMAKSIDALLYGQSQILNEGNRNYNRTYGRNNYRQYSKPRQSSTNSTTAWDQHAGLREWDTMKNDNFRGACYNCGRKGHFARACGQTRQYC